ncbi:MAG: hypothetical protein ACJ74O_18140 [Frankiaceae bacterium]
MTKAQDNVPSSADEGTVLVISLWREPDHPRSMRARITYRDSVMGERGTAAAADPERVLAIVGEWLARFMHGQ